MGKDFQDLLNNPFLLRYFLLLGVLVGSHSGVYQEMMRRRRKEGGQEERRQGLALWPLWARLQVSSQEER